MYIVIGMPKAVDTALISDFSTIGKQNIQGFTIGYKFTIVQTPNVLPKDKLEGLIWPPRVNQ